jgi:hypothetical protein
VLACFALARRYRDRLGLPHPFIRVVHLDDSSGVIRQRMEQRTSHFIPTTLLSSQLNLLERPTSDEQPSIVDVASEPEAARSTRPGTDDGRPSNAHAACMPSDFFGKPDSNLVNFDQRVPLAELVG